MIRASPRLSSKLRDLRVFWDHLREVYISTTSTFQTSQNLDMILQLRRDVLDRMRLACLQEVDPQME